MFSWPLYIKVQVAQKMRCLMVLDLKWGYNSNTKSSTVKEIEDILQCQLIPLELTTKAITTIDLLFASESPSCPKDEMFDSLGFKMSLY